MIINFIMRKGMTDEEMYQQLKHNTLPGLMDAEEWKGLRLIQLNKEGRIWSK